MSRPSGKVKHGQGEAVIVQRPLRRYQQEMARSDEELARRLQEQEKIRSQQFHEDERLAHQLSMEMNGQVGGTNLQAEFVRYRGMTEVDRMMAQQIQGEQDTHGLMQQRRLLQHLSSDQPDGTPDSRGNLGNRGNAHPVGARQPGMNLVLGGWNRHGNRQLQIGLGRVGRAGQGPVGQQAAGNLPEGEDDPDLMLLTMGGGIENNFLNIMRDPLLLVMALSRAPQFTALEGNVDLNDYEALWELGERLGEVQRRGITDAELEDLPTHSFQEGASAISTSDCHVCLAAFEAGETLRTLPCMHDFHSQCIDQWLKRNSTCPICRQEVKPLQVTNG